MKRSEMLSVIQEALKHRIVGCTVCPDYVADQVLFSIERVGMLPPGYMKPIPVEKDGKQYPLIPGDFKNEQGVWCTPGINEWENE